jgi:predicted permease
VSDAGERPAWSWLDAGGRDLRFGLRTLRRSPGFAASAVLTLGLCIGANTAIFSLIDAVLLRPLPYPRPERLVDVALAWRGAGGQGLEIYQDGHAFSVIRDRCGLLESAAAGPDGGVNFAVRGKPEYLRQQRVSTGFFRVLGVRPRLGREFTAEEDRPGAPQAAILSDALWRRVFHADPAAIGRSVSLGGEPAVVVGVMPAGFQTDAPEDLWAPLRPAETGEGERGPYEVVARLRPGATLAAAEAQVEGLSSSALSEQVQAGVSVRLRLVPLERARSRTSRAPLLVLWAAVGAVLLIGCVNVAGLLLARSKSRAREIAIRLALGCDRPAIVRQPLVESLLLAAAGGAAGLTLASIGLRALLPLAGATFKVPAAGLDLRVLAATAGLSLCSGLLFGLLPALRAGDVDLRAVMAPAGAVRVTRQGTMHRWPHRLLVIGEVALCMALLIAAGLLVRSLAALGEVRPGFEAANVMTTKLSLHDARYRTSRQVAHLFEAGLSRIRELPGVESAAAGLAVPYERWLYMGWQRLDGRPRAPVQNLVLSYVTADYFTTLRIPVLRGRAIDGGDRAGSEPVVVVSEAFAREYMPNGEALGSRISIGGQARRIVGVVGDVQQRQGWTDSSPLTFLSPLPAGYLPVTQTGDDLLRLAHVWFSPSWVVRSTAPPAALLRGIQRAVAAIDPQLPLAGFHTMAEVQAAALQGRRLLAVLLALFAGLALALAVVAIYSLIASTVAERTQELAIRMALGATVRQAMTEVAVPGVLLAAGGIVIGSLFAGLTSHVLRHLLWGVSPTDSFTFTAVPLLLLLVAAAASIFPARQVARLDPARTLRQE